jgi:hypothetical protein
MLTDVKIPNFPILSMEINAAISKMSKTSTTRMTGIAIFSVFFSFFINKNSNFVLKTEEQVASSAFEIRLWLHHFVQTESQAEPRR